MELTRRRFILGAGALAAGLTDHPAPRLGQAAPAEDDSPLQVSGSTPPVTDSFNVRDFGARGDGLSDDLPSIGAAIVAATSAHGGVVFVPPGVYKVSRAIELSSNVKLQGTGYGSVIQISSVSTSTVVLSGPTVARASIEDLRIISADAGTGSITDGSALYLAGARIAVRRCWVSGAKVSNITLVGASYCIVEDNELSGVNPSASLHIGSTDITFNGPGRQVGHRIARNRCLSINKTVGIQGLVNDSNDITDCDIEENLVVGTIKAPNGHGIILYITGASTGRTLRCRILDNRVREVACNGIYALGNVEKRETHEDLQIIGNQVFDANRGGADGTIVNAGIACVGMNGGIVAHNIVVGFSNAPPTLGFGIALSQSSLVLVTDNVVRSGPAMYQAFASDDNTSGIMMAMNHAIATDETSGGGFRLKGVKHRVIGNFARGWTICFQVLNATGIYLDGNISEAARVSGLEIEASSKDARIQSHFDMDSALNDGVHDNGSAGTFIGEGARVTTPVRKSAYTPVYGESLIPVDTTERDVQITLPAKRTSTHSKPAPGTRFTIFLDAAGSHRCTITPEAGLINGQEKIELSVPATAKTCEFDGKNYRAY